MANDKDITIGLATVGDTSGAEAVEKSIFAVEDAAQKAQREMDRMEAQRRVSERESASKGAAGGGGLLGTNVDDLGKSLAGAAGVGEEYAAVTKIVSANQIAIAGSVVAIGAAAAKAYELLDGTVSKYQDLKREVAEINRSLREEDQIETGPELDAEIAKIERAIGPLKNVVDAVKSSVSDFFKLVKDPVGELTGLNDLHAAFERQAASVKKLNAERLKLATENQAQVAQNYQVEEQALLRQEQALARILGLRSQMQSLAEQAANQEVEAARLRGGDVELAQANALAVKLEGELSKLADNLLKAQGQAEQAQSKQTEAQAAYQKAVDDGLAKLDPKEFEKIANALDTANQGVADANQAISDQAQIYEVAKQNVLRGTENALAKMETETVGSVSAGAQKVRDEIYSTIQTESQKGAEAISQIQVQAGAITESAAAKASEVQQGLSAERAVTVQAIQALAPQPQDTAAITQAVNEVGNSIREQGNATISALATVAATSKGITARLEAQQRQIEQIFARIR